jgi:acyl-CoA synthetase (AMP-forming)/AMP-acid ligase II
LNVEKELSRRLPIAVLEGLGGRLPPRGLTVAFSAAVKEQAMAHASGLYLSLSYVRAGVPFIMLQTGDGNSVLDNIERYRGTWFFGFPYQYAGLLEAQQSKPRDVSSLRMCLTAADVCPIDLQKRVTETLRAPLYNYWAASEVAGQLTFGLQPGPVVRITEDASIRLVDKNGADVARGEVGELLIRVRMSSSVTGTIRWQQLEASRMAGITPAT